MSTSHQLVKILEEESEGLLTEDVVTSLSPVLLIAENSSVDFNEEYSTTVPRACTSPLNENDNLGQYDKTPLLPEDHLLATNGHLVREKTDFSNTEEVDDSEKKFAGKTNSQRDELIEKFNQVLSERQKLQDQQAAVQFRLAECLRKKRGDEDSVSQMSNKKDHKNLREEEKRFYDNLMNFEKLKTEAKMTAENIREKLKVQNEICQHNRQLVVEHTTKLEELKKQTLSRIFQGSPSTIKTDVDKLIASEGEKDAEIEAIGLKNIRLKIKIQKLETHLRQKEQVAEGLNVLDFEQLKIENQTYNEKVEEKNEEILKLKNKMSKAVQVLTHTKEKLSFSQELLQNEKTDLVNLEKSLAQMRDELSHIKAAKDSSRNDNNKMKLTGGLIDNEILLKDFQECVESCENMRHSIEHLRHVYSLLLEGEQ